MDLSTGLLANPWADSRRSSEVLAVGTTQVIAFVDEMAPKQLKAILAADIILNPSLLTSDADSSDMAALLPL